MTLTEQELEHLANAPSPTEMSKIVHTHQLVKDVLARNLPTEEIKQKYGISSLDYDVYLQGSYANHTNISLESDIDIVVQLNNSFWSDKSQLTPPEVLLHEASHSDSKYKFLEFKQDVFNALKEYFGESTEYSGKCIKIHENTNRVKADIVPCLQYRVYKRFISLYDHTYVEGIKFINTEDNTPIVSFPKIHLQNCESKNIDTDGNFKSMIRIYKNIKTRLIDANIITDDLAANYYIENLLYNCTNPTFDGNRTECILQTLQFIDDSLRSGRAAGFLCANEQHALFTPGKWNLVDAQTFMAALAEYYINN